MELVTTTWDIPIGLYRSTPDGRILEANQALVKILGYPDLETFLAIDAGDLYVDPADRRRWMTHMERDGLVRDFQMQLRRYDGTVIWVQDNARAVYAQDTTPFNHDHVLGRGHGLTDREKPHQSKFDHDRVLYYEGSIEDITARKRVEDELTKLSSAVDNTMDSVFITDADGVIEYVNPAFETLTGYTYDEVIGKRPHILQSSEHDRRFSEALWDTIRFSGKGFSASFMNRKKSGELYYQEETITPVTDGDGKVTHIVSIGRDITERVQRERELEAVTTVATAMRTAATREAMLPIILDQTIALLDADGAAIALATPQVNDRQHQEAPDEVIVELGHGACSDWTGQRLKPECGIIGQAIASGEPCLINDVRLAAHVMEPSIPDEIQAVACIPLIAREHAIGALWVGSATKITAEQLQLLTAIGDMAANAIHRATLHEETDRRLQHLKALHTIDTAINASPDLDATLDVLLDQATANLKVDAGAVLLFDTETQTLKYAASTGFHEGSIETTRLHVGEGQAGRAVQEQRIVPTPDVSAIARRDARARVLQRKGIQAHVAAPLITNGEVKGILELFHRGPLTPTPEWLEFLEMLAGQAAIAVHNAELFQKLQRSNVELAQAYDATIEGWAHTLELRDIETEGHSRRVTEMTLQLARQVGIASSAGAPERGVASGAGTLEHIRRGALLHDIGKMGIPDSILFKPGPLDDREWRVMRKHPVYACQLLSSIDFLEPALPIPDCHHEKWDGSGYPHGLRGEEIPLPARIFAVVDVFDALTSDRPYREAWPAERALEYIEAEAGSHFDPDIAGVFLDMWNDG